MGLRSPTPPSQEPPPLCPAYLGLPGPVAPPWAGGWSLGTCCSRSGLQGPSLGGTVIWGTGHCSGYWVSLRPFPGHRGHRPGSNDCVTQAGCHWGRGGGLYSSSVYQGRTTSPYSIGHRAGSHSSTRPGPVLSHRMHWSQLHALPSELPGPHREPGRGDAPSR